MNRTLCIAALVILCAACAVKTEQSTDTSAVGSTTSAVKPTPDSVVFVQGDPTVHIDSAESTNRPTSPAPAEPSPPPAGTSFRITPNSFGPLRVGMTVAAAASAMGGGFAAPRGYDGGCGYATLTKAPAGLAVMLQGGKIARFEVRSGGTKTAEGAGIGDSEAKIKSLYGSTVATTPHKYVQGGHYLTVTPSAGSSNRIVFETDGARVTEYRSGKTPEVEQVERCG